MKAFRNQPIITKMRLMTAAIIIVFIVVLLLSFGTYWLLGSRRSMEESLEQSAERASLSLDNDFRSITESFVSIFGSESFSMKMTDMINPYSDKIQNRVIVQDELMRIAAADHLIVSALIYDTESDVTYSLFRDVLIPSRARVLWNSELVSISGIEILPERPSPIRGQDTIIPMVFPLVYRYNGAFMADDKGELIVIILLSPEEIRKIMPQDSILRDKQGSSITEEVSLAVNGKGVYQAAAELPFSDLELVAYADFTARLLDLMWTAATSILAAILALLAFTILFSFILRHYVTLPIGKLKTAVSEIERGNYSVRADFSGSDELGELRDAISRMATTIDSQIGAIRDEQEKRTKTEMRLLTEQLTPHFLYNTLECIQQEIQTGNSRASSEMTRALSIYLRTVLAYGKETILIKNEIQHDMSYIRIMNGRFRRNVIYQHMATPETQECEILKMVLQPFIENSIKHGFGIGDESTWVQQPEIITSFTLSDGRIRMEISDNGKGFDEDEYLAIMHGERGSGHIGIRNTYLRLIKFYGEENVAIDVSSIPYFRSTVTIEVPMLHEAEDESTE